MILDSHQHFWEYNIEKHNWITEDMSVIRKDFLPQDLVPILKNNLVEGCIVVQAEQTEEETKRLVQWANQNTFIKGVVGWVDLLNPLLEERLAFWSQYKIVKGFRHIVEEESNDFLLRPDVQAGVQWLGKYGYTYDILITQEQLPRAIELVRKLPKQSFVLDHLAKPSISLGVDKEWKKNIQILGACPNVFCKLSGMVTETEKYSWERKDFKDFLEIVVHSFGVDRIMFGSDWPVCLVSAQYAEVLAIVSSYFATFSKEDYNKVMGGNCAKFYTVNE